MKDEKQEYSLVGMYATIWSEDKLKHTVFIYGKVNDTHFIVQAINSLTGTPNVCRVVNVSDMRNLVFYPTRELAEECIDDYTKNGINRFYFLY